MNEPLSPDSPEESTAQPRRTPSTHGPASDRPGSPHPGLSGPGDRTVADSSLECTYFEVDTPDSSSPPTLDSTQSPYGLDELELLAQGGMGQILQGIDPDLGRQVALKVILPEVLGSQRIREKFLNEARITSQLEHPGIIPVHKLGQTTDGRDYFTMKLVRGATLEQVLHELRDREDPKAVLRARSQLLRHFLKICDALALAHSRQVIHRDLKPENIMIGEFGEVLVMDWGLAKFLDETESAFQTEPSTVNLPSTPTATLDGQVQGTPSYMSPEQVEGKIDAIDQRSDIYALGTILYEILCLERAFAGREITQIFEHIRAGQLPSPCERSPHLGIPHELEAVALKAMASDPAMRYAGVTQLQEDIQAYLDGRVLEAARYTPLQRVRKWVGRNKVTSSTIGTLILSTTLLFGWNLWNGNRQRQAEAARHIEIAQNLIATHPDAQALLRKASPRLTPHHLLSSYLQLKETHEQRAEREKSLSAYLDAAAHLDRALSRIPGDEKTRQLRRKVGAALGTLAILGRDYSLARRAFLDLKSFGDNSEAIRNHMSKIEKARNAIMDRRRERLLEIVADLDADLHRPDRLPDAPIFEELVDEAVSYQDEQTATLLGSRLDEMTRRAQKVRKSRKEPTWSRIDRERARFLCAVLSRLRFSESIPPLGRWILSLRDHQLLVEAGKALCRTRNPDVIPYLQQTQVRIGSDSPSWKQLKHDLKLIPDLPSSTAPTSAEDYLNRGILRHDQKRLKEALEDLNRAVQLNPNSSEPYHARGVVLSELGRHEEALRDLNQVIQMDPKRSAAYLNRAIIYSSFSEKRSHALADYKTYIQLEPHSATGYMNLGNCLRKMKRYPEAIKQLDQALALRPEYALAHMSRGRCLIQLKRYKEAIQNLSIAVRIDPEQSWPYFHRAQAYHARKEFAQAILDYDNCTQRFPGNYQAYFHRAKVHFDRKDYKNALNDWRQALELAPKWTAIHHNMAICLSRLNRTEEAVTEYEKLLQADPKSTRTIKSILQLLQKTGGSQRAAAWIRSFLGKNPNTPHQAQLQQLLEKLSPRSK
ncbi:MAG: serine/threonine-protein kinase [Planctomycetota bacterium]|nr:serine/threonine-protein kinase [Planctomycetota bacterium]